MRELTCNSDGYFHTNGQSGLDLEGCPPENLGVCGDDTVMSRAARTRLEGAYLLVEDVTNEEGSAFWDHMVPEEDDEDTLGDFLADEETEDTTEEIEDDDGGEIPVRESDDYDTMEARETAEVERIRVQNARRELARRRADETLKAEMAAKQIQQWQAEQAEREVTKAEREAQAKANTKPTQLQELAEQFRTLDAEYTAAVNARKFDEADKLDAKKRELKAKMDELKVELEREQTEELAISEGHKAQRQLAYQQKRIPELEAIVATKDPEKDKDEIAKINGSIEFWGKNTPALEQAVAKMEKILASRAPKPAEKPAPTRQQVKVPTFKCRCCGKEIEAYHVKVEPYWVIEKERNISIHEGMTAEQVYGDRTFCLECIHDVTKGPKGDKIFPLLVSMRGLKAWDQGRGDRARRSEERREERRRQQDTRPARSWEAAPGRPVRFRTITG